MLREGLGPALRELNVARPNAVVFGCNSAASTSSAKDAVFAVEASAATAGAPTVGAMQTVLDRASIGSSWNV